MPLRKKVRSVGTIILFFSYFLLLCYFLFFSERMGRHVEVQEYRYNLRPFFEIRRFFRMLRAGNLQAFAVNFLGNIVAFMPFGYFLPLLVKKCQNMFRIVLLSFELSLFVELIQLIFKLGCFDVDDLLLNTVGGLLGYLVYLIFYGRKNRDVP